MHISELNLTNFRGARSLTMSLHPRLNVFYGENGAGKSTALDATALLLSWLVNRIKTRNASGRPITEQDIYNGKPAASIDLTLQTEAGTFSWSIAKTRKGIGSKNTRSILEGVNQLAAVYQTHIEQAHDTAALPLLAYFPVNRAVLDIPLRIRNRHRFDPLSAYEDALTSGANFRTFFEWFREREDLENENRRYLDYPTKPEGFQFPDPQLVAVRQALAQVMPQLEGLTVRRNPLRMEVVKNGEWLTVNQLSDGEKCLMALTADLARRMAIANPGASKPLTQTGIVLIDEIDLHLHPNWQRMILPKLTETFPGCQFMVSTHSPHVLNHVHPDSLYVLKQAKGEICAERPAESYGKNIDRVLEATIDQLFSFP